LKTAPIGSDEDNSDDNENCPQEDTKEQNVQEISSNSDSD